MKRFYSNGKFLITGEYFVLAGAKAFAVPLKIGQRMEVDNNLSQKEIHWEVSDTKGSWFTVKISLPDLNILETNNQTNADFLARALEAAKELNTDFLKHDGGFMVRNELEFNRDWGMGSSSTFLANLAKWSGVNAFELHQKVMNGSGYDIACAYADSPLLFERKFDHIQMESVKWNPVFEKHIAFVYLGEKQDSATSIVNFRELDIKDSDIKKINKLSEGFWLTHDHIDLMDKMWEHEEIVGKVLNQRPVQDELFRDFNGAVKSLGAWGGDFVMAVGREKFKKIQKYFVSKGYPVVLPWHIVL